MTEFHRVFIDTAPFIYLLDDDPRYGPAAMRAFQELLDSGTELVSSVLTCQEYLIAPYRTGNREKEAAFLSFLADCGVALCVIDEETAKKAARIRAEYRGFKSMDALQLAAACQSGCGLFLTNDKQLLQFREMECRTLEGFL